MKKNEKNEHYQLRLILYMLYTCLPLFNKFFYKEGLRKEDDK